MTENILHCYKCWFVRGCNVRAVAIREGASRSGKRTFYPLCATCAEDRDNSDLIHTLRKLKKNRKDHMKINFGQMTDEELQAYEWAIKQEFQSVAARYARTLARFIQSNAITEQIVVTPERFCYSFDGELYYGSYSSRRDALKAAVGERMAGFEGTSLKDAANRELLGLTVFTARNRQPDLLSQIDGGWVIDVMQQADDCGIEAAEDWPNATRDQVDDLTQRLRATVLEWMKLYDLEPKFWIAEDVEQHTLTSLDGLV